MGISNDDTWGKCKKEAMGETLYRRSCFWPAFARNRLRYLEASHFKELDEVPWLAFLNFAKTVGRIHDDYFSLYYIKPPSDIKKDRLVLEKSPNLAF